VRPGVLLESVELTQSLERQGAEDVVTLKLRKKLDTITHFVIATGRSPLHLHKMGETIVSAVSQLCVL